MSLAQRVKQLRTEHAWSQNDLAERIGADPAQISRYEHARITPSADAIIRLAETFDVSCDYLLVDNAPRRPFRSPQDTLGDHLASVAELDPQDQQALITMLDALVTKTRLRTLTNHIN